LADGFMPQQMEKQGVWGQLDTVEDEAFVDALLKTTSHTDSIR
jgi:hypothetical protein